nr:hypothetical protein CFP56_12938 [Quercus suber]
MASLQSPRPRQSQETDRHHLLADSDSIAPSESASLYVPDGDRTPRATSPNPTAAQHLLSRRETITDPTPQPYKGFPSEAHYLAALHAWAETKKYLEPEKMLVGWYGEKTMEEYASAPKLELGLRKKWKARKEAKQEAKNVRRNTKVKFSDQIRPVAVSTLVRSMRSYINNVTTTFVFVWTTCSFRLHHCIGQSYDLFESLVSDVDVIHDCQQSVSKSLKSQQIIAPLEVQSVDLRPPEPCEPSWFTCSNGQRK